MGKEKDKKVGYKNPPTSSRFRKGQSGNPNGRPKKSIDLKELLEGELQEKVFIKEGGKKVKVTRAQAMMKRLVNSALQGDARAIMLIAKMFPSSTHPQSDDGPQYTMVEIQKILGISNMEDA